MELSYISIGIFTLVIVGLLALDLGVFRKEDKAVSNKEALLWSAIWISLGLSFGVYLRYSYSETASTEYFTAFLIEKALSMDNLFIFVLVFKFFNIPDKFQHRVLFWGILGAIFFRAILIFSGVELIKITYVPPFDIGNLHIDEFNVILFAFGVFLLFTGIKTFKKHEEENAEISEHLGVRFVKKFISVHPHIEGNNFFIRKNGKIAATLLFLALVVIELSDILFALDSIPAIFTITQDPVILYTSNIFAILGLRSLYFLLANSIHLFQYLRVGLAFILVFIGIKMLAAPFYHVPPFISLGVIGATLLISISASLIVRKYY
ncbi:MAG: TerC/Alx family metal homeostasis membrane protein [Flavobacteriales bacterium]|nr:MAG: TerC/Alx family metal homeostasis membrane protein [Flavobacteriales bacterium]